MELDTEDEVRESRRPLDAGRLTRTLTAPVGPLARVSVVPVVESSNTHVVEAIQRGAPWPHLSALVAEWQTAGRGRAGRTWVTPNGTSITASFVVRPTQVPPERFGWAPLLAGLAVVRALRHLKVEASLKWPNDVIIDDPAGRFIPGWDTARKVGGILCEAVDGAVVIGIGINVSQRHAELPVSHATSLALAGASNLDRGEILAATATELASVFRQWDKAKGVGSLGGSVEGVCATIGREVTVDRPGLPSLDGYAIGLGPEGGLKVEVGPGLVETILAGDVTVRSG